MRLKHFNFYIGVWEVLRSLPTLRHDVEEEYEAGYEFAAAYHAANPPRTHRGSLTFFQGVAAYCEHNFAQSKLLDGPIDAARSEGIRTAAKLAIEFVQHAHL